MFQNLHRLLIFIYTIILIDEIQTKCCLILSHLLTGYRLRMEINCQGITQILL